MHASSESYSSGITLWNEYHSYLIDEGTAEEGQISPNSLASKWQRVLGLGPRESDKRKRALALKSHYHAYSKPWRHLEDSEEEAAVETVMKLLQNLSIRQRTGEPAVVTEKQWDKRKSRKSVVHQMSREENGIWEGRDQRNAAKWSKKSAAIKWAVILFAFNLQKCDIYECNKAKHNETRHSCTVIWRGTEVIVGGRCKLKEEVFLFFETCMILSCAY